MIKVATIGECMLELSTMGTAPFDGETKFGFGGDTLNVAVYLIRAITEKKALVSYVTALGDDPFSEALLDAWRKEGLSTDLVQRIEGRLPGMYLIRTDPTGERSFFYWREQAAARLMLDAGRTEDLGAALAGYDLVYLSGITLAILWDSAKQALLDLIHYLSEQGVHIAFDSNHRPHLWPSEEEARIAYESLAPYVTIALPTFADEAAMFDDKTPQQTARRWRQWGVGEVAVKNDKEACFLSTTEGEWQIPALAVDYVVDTTAAGDSFNGTYLANRMEGRSAHHSIERAHAVAASVIAQRGAIVQTSN